MNINKEITNLKVVLAYLEAKAALLETTEETTEEWYHNIPPEGVLCYVSDEPQDTVGLTLYEHKVYSYNHGAVEPFVTTAPSRGTYVAWKYATPVHSNQSNQSN
tara:strand:- start:1018 stop:1329 length:312 start_codon:yes stop_codon:yes gene_type:complete